MHQGQRRAIATAKAQQIARARAVSARAALTNRARVERQHRGGSAGGAASVTRLHAGTAEGAMHRGSRVARQPCWHMLPQPAIRS
jgi:hypothetical protein